MIANTFISRMSKHLFLRIVYRNLFLQFVGGADLNQDFYLLEYKYFNGNGERKNTHYLDLYHLFRCKTSGERLQFVKGKIEDAVTKSNEV